MGPSDLAGADMLTICLVVLMQSDDLEGVVIL